MTITDAEMKALWKKHGGDQHGPRIEQYYIEERAWYRFARELVEAAEQRCAEKDAEIARLRKALEALVEEYTSSVDPYRVGGFHQEPNTEEVIIDARAALGEQP